MDVSDAACMELLAAWQSDSLVVGVPDEGALAMLLAADMAEDTVAQPPQKSRKKGLTKAELEASRRYRRRKKERNQALEEAVAEKQRQIAALEAANEQLRLKEEALQTLVASTDVNMAALQNSISGVSLSGRTASGSHVSGGANDACGATPRTAGGPFDRVLQALGFGAAAPASPAAAAAVRPAAPVDSGGASAGASAGSVATATSGVTGAPAAAAPDGGGDSDAAAAASSSDTDDGGGGVWPAAAGELAAGVPGDGLPARRALTPLEEDAAVAEFRAYYRSLVEQLAQLLLKLDAAGASTAAGASALAEIESLVLDFGCRIRDFAFGAGNALRKFAALQLDTGRPAEKMPTEHWRRVMIASQVAAERARRVIVLYEVYRKRVVRLQAERRRLFQRLSGPPPPGSPLVLAPSAPAPGAADGETYGELVAAIQRNFNQELGYEGAARAAVLSVLTCEEVARSLVACWPLVADAHEQVRGIIAAVPALAPLLPSGIGCSDSPDEEVPGWVAAWQAAPLVQPPLLAGVMPALLGCGG